MVMIPSLILLKIIPYNPMGVYFEIYPWLEGNTVKFNNNIPYLRVIYCIRLYFIVYPDLSHNTDILTYDSSIDLPKRSMLEELILRIALTAWQYGKILPSWWSNTGELNFNIIMFSNWECDVSTDKKEPMSISLKKSRIRETPNLSPDADNSTNIFSRNKIKKFQSRLTPCF